MKESHIRSLLKALSWRVFATFTTILISYIITKEIAFAVYIGLFEFISKICFYYFHERIWAFIPFGIRKHENNMIP